MDIESNLIQEERQESTSDLFELQHWDLPSVQNNILAIAVSEQFIYILTKKREIIRWQTGKIETQKQAYSLDRNQSETLRNPTYYKLFCDHSGYHCIICIDDKVYYFNGTKDKVKELDGPSKNRIKEINAIAFNESNRDKTTTQEMLVVDNTSRIFSWKITEDSTGKKPTEILAELFKLPQNEPILGIHFGKSPAGGNHNNKYIIAVTKTKLYQFVGGDFQSIFEKYRNEAILENATKQFPTLNKPFEKSMLQMLYRGDSLYSFGWMTNAGFCFGEYFTNQVTVNNYVIFPYVKIQKVGRKETDDIPIATCHTENHVFILYSDCITIISKITSNIIHTQYLNNERFSDMIYDPFHNSIWIYSTQDLYQITLDHENDNIWQDYLEKGDYNKAMGICSQEDQSRFQKIARLYGDECFEKGDDNNSSVNYALSDAKFEEVCLKYLLRNKYDALKNYLSMIDAQRLDDTHLTQKFLISTWYVEILLNELNADPNKSSEQLMQFIKEKQKYLDTDTIYQLLQHYGRIKEFLDFAKIKKDYETIILHYINEKDIKTALTQLEDFAEDNGNTEEKINEISNIFTRYSHSFMKYEPQKTIDILKSKQKTLNIDPNKIISAIMSTDKANYPSVKEYLKKLVEDPKMKEKNIHNLYVFYLSKEQNSKDELIMYLKKPLEAKDRKKNKKTEVLFELDYAKKLFSQNYPALALVLALMGKYSEAVKTALTHKEQDIAEFIAKNVEDPKIKKSLWLDIFSASNSENKTQQGTDFKKALDIMEQSTVLKIEDVLPRIMDNIKIDDFKDKISTCIDVYEKNIQELKKDITDYNLTAEKIKSDIYKVKKRSMEIQYRQCKCEICNNYIKDSNIFLFPCGHMFDSQCIINKLVEYGQYLDSIKPKVAKVIELKAKIEETEEKKKQQKENAETKKEGIFGLFKKFDQSKNAEITKVSNEELKKLEENTETLNDILSEECVLCGDYMVESTQCSFSGDKVTWMLV